MDDVARLREINERIGAAENRGDEEAKRWLDGALAPALAFRRANEVIDNRQAFLDKVVPSPPRTTVVDSIEIIGKHRAIVRATVTVHNGEPPPRYSNLRLFVRVAGEWKLLGWANEPL
jgi:hypothetical protein